ncbi:MAG: multicopper oxidase domain-containing protein [Gemmatimonadota bacterium]|nr:multicopper oxidase domain-containing protein [Gemmatimonadota bacterium]
MRPTFTILAAAAALAGPVAAARAQRAPTTTDTARTRGQLLAADRALRRDVERRGSAAFIEALDAGAAVLMPFQPILRRASEIAPALRARYDAPASYRWIPVHAVAGIGGRFGCTVGVSRFAPGGDSTHAPRSGRYITCWRRDARGRWRIVGHQRSDSQGSPNGAPFDTTMTRAPHSATVAGAASARDEVIATERRFATAGAARADGPAAAFVEFIAEDGVVMAGAELVRGKRAVEHLFDGWPAGNVLVWGPDVRICGGEGGLAWTAGNSHTRTGDGRALRRGHFFTVWRQEPDGRWRYLFDLGSPRPETDSLVGSTIGSGLVRSPASSPAPAPQPLPLIGATLITARRAPQTIERATPVHCPNRTLGAADLACTDLVPTPDLNGASAVLELTPVSTPFGVSVTVDGHPRQRLAAAIAGLPDPHTLGDYSVYVAWAYTLTLADVVKLGVVANGRTDLGELDYNQFRIIVSAERSPSAVERTGRLVLRGTSPSARLMAHRDLFQPAAPGAMRDIGSATAMSMRDMPPGSLHEGAATRWPMPPTPSWMPMMPGMSGLVPDATPFRAGATIDPASIPSARPHDVISLRDGDTLALDARLVRRTIRSETFTMYGFNGQYPGPLLEVGQGATIIVQFHNGIDQPTTVHWHGVRLDNRFDGVPGVTQPLVSPGGRFTYRVHFRDAGIYWYHPHHREDIQQDLGLYGNLLVRSPDRRYYGPANREEILMLDDLLLGGDGPAPYGVEAPINALMGRFGNVFLVNGEPHYTLAVRHGEVVRFFVTNVSSARLYNVSFAKARMKVVASDVGKFEREAWVTSVVIAPAERYVIEVEFAEPGTVALVNRVQALDHMAGTFSSEVDTLGLVQVAKEAVRPEYAAAFATLRRNEDVIADIARARASFARPADHTVDLTLRAHGLPAAVSSMLWGINTPVDWNDGMPMMNWITTGKQVTWVLRDRDSGKENMDIAWRFREGDRVKLRFVNDPSASHAMDHPIHLHGQRFLVLSRNDVPSDNLVWKDTAIIPAGETVDLLVDMSNPGRWMMHCHIAEHVGSGMMALFTVMPRTRHRTP